jgi:hypothetical protein
MIGSVAQAVGGVRTGTKLMGVPDFFISSSSFIDT